MGEFTHHSEQKLVSLLNYPAHHNPHQGQLERFSRGENGKTSQKAASTLGMGETHKAERKMFGFLIICGKQTAGGN